MSRGSARSRTQAEIDRFRTFVEATERRIWLPVAAEVGPDAADDAVAQAFAYAWQHWSRVAGMDNPAGYVFRAAQRYARDAARRAGRSFPVDVPGSVSRLPEFEPGLMDALAALTPNQRQAVFLVEGCGWTLVEAADLIGVSVSTLRNHVARGMAGLRARLEVRSDV